MLKNIQTTGEMATYLLLKKAGWNPQKSLLREKGMPDFKCENLRWVEVKSINVDNAISLHAHQLRKWLELARENYEIYLIITNEKYVSELIDVTKVSLMEFITTVKNMAYHSETYGVNIWEDQELIKMLQEQQSTSMKKI